MCKIRKIILNLIYIQIINSFLLFPSVMSSWEYSVVTSKKIFFFNKYWDTVATAANSFTAIKSFAYDEVKDILYFHASDDRENSIYTLNLVKERNHEVKTLLRGDRHIQSMDFDPLTRTLFWLEEKDLFKMNVSEEAQYEGMLPVKIESGLPNLTSLYGIALDTCNQNIYFTDFHLRYSAVHSVTYDGQANNFTKIDKDIYTPREIVFDADTEYIYWVESKTRGESVIEKVHISGENRTRVATIHKQTITDLIVTDDTIYWIDDVSRNIYGILKDNFDNTPVEPIIYIEFKSDDPQAFLQRSKYKSYYGNSDKCTEVFRKIHEIEDIVTKKEENSESRCLNGGTWNEMMDNCSCTPEFKGKFCEMAKCENYCFKGNGKCVITNKMPKCNCQDGFLGERCEINVCMDHCLNGGTCEIKNNATKCHCRGTFTGNRCETDACHNYCLNKGLCSLDENSSPICRCKNPFSGQQCENSCNDFCVNNATCRIDKDGQRTCDCLEFYEGVHCESVNVEKLCSTEMDEHTRTKFSTFIKICANSNYSNLASENFVPTIREMPCHYTKSVIIFSISITVPLALIIIIILLIRRFYKPLRPRITKKMIVKNYNAPMTARPHTQCEITIEDCCNMNICETPCFDTNLLAKKSDKINLLDDADSIDNSMPISYENNLLVKKADKSSIFFDDSASISNGSNSNQ